VRHGTGARLVPAGFRRNSYGMKVRRKQYITQNE
jgi:hypothetical protein